MFEHKHCAQITTMQMKGREYIQSGVLDKVMIAPGCDKALQCEILLPCLRERSLKLVNEFFPCNFPFSIFRLWLNVVS